MCPDTSVLESELVRQQEGRSWMMELTKKGSLNGYSEVNLYLSSLSLRVFRLIPRSFAVTT